MRPIRTSATRPVLARRSPPPLRTADAALPRTGLATAELVARRVEAAGRHREPQEWLSGAARTVAESDRRHAERARREYREFSSALRRLPPVPSLTIHRRRGAVWTHGVRRALTTRQFDLLVYLIGLGGAVATREDVLGAVWREDRPPEGTRTVDMHIARIREKLDLASVIVTVRGQGYRFNTSIALDETSGL